MTRKEKRARKLRRYVLKYFPCFYIDKEDLKNKRITVLKLSSEWAQKYAELTPIIDLAKSYADNDTSTKATDARINADFAKSLVKVIEDKCTEAKEDYFNTWLKFSFRYPFAENGYFTKRDVKKFIKGA